ncbi:MAG: CbtB-domain containing protein [Firmicutes bacterium]|nr:CbtB-domain containing protein [Bacillota bacterium]
MFHAVREATRTRLREVNIFGFVFSARFQVVAITVFLAAALYAVFFSAYPATHDFFHELRHATGFIGCH